MKFGEPYRLGGTLLPTMPGSRHDAGDAACRPTLAAESGGHECATFNGSTHMIVIGGIAEVQEAGGQAAVPRLRNTRNWLPSCDCSAR